jgi:hypothetical protein
MNRPTRHTLYPVRSFALLAGMTTLLVILFGTAANAGTVTTSSVLKEMRSDLATQTGVHVDFVGHAASSSLTENIIANVGTASGSETIFEGKADLAIRVNPTFAYVSGNSSGLTTRFGITAAEAKKLGTDWASWKAGSKQYANLKSDVTLFSVTALLPKVKGTKLSARTSGGVPRHVLTWTSAATSSLPRLSNTLVVSDGQAVLPISQTAVAKDGTKVTTTLSKWNESIIVHAPPTASTINSSHL